MYRLILTIIILSSWRYSLAQPATNSNDSMLTKAIQKQIIFPYADKAADTAGITLIKVSKNEDSLYVDLIYASGNRFTLDNDKYFRYRLNKTKATFPDGYSAYVPIYFEFHLEGDHIVMADNAIKEKLAQKIKSLGSDAHILQPIIVEGFPVVH